MLHDMLIGLAVILMASVFAQGLKVSTEPTVPVGPDRQEPSVVAAADRS